METFLKPQKRKMLIVSVHTTGLISFNTMMSNLIFEHITQPKLTIAFDHEKHRVIFTIGSNEEIDLKTTNKILCCCSKDVTGFILATDSKIRLKQSKKFEMHPIARTSETSAKAGVSMAYWIDCTEPVI